MEHAEFRPSLPARLVVYGRLLRLSLAPSALADVAAGVLLGSGGAWPAGSWPWRLMLASACVYHGAMALNDWADREHDRRTRPERPLPSGAVLERAALGLGIGLPLAGVLLAWGVAPGLGVVALGLALAASAYDLAGRGPWLGPGLLALCRAGNLALGVLAGWLVSGLEPEVRSLLPALVYGAYVFVVSRLGRLEDGEEGGELGVRPRRLLMRAAGWLVVLPLAGLVPGAVPGDLAGAAAALVLSLLAARGLVGAAREEGPWTLPRVGRSMGLALRRLLIVSAAVALLCADLGRLDGWLVAAGVLAGYPVALLLRRVFPPS